MSEKPSPTGAPRLRGGLIVPEPRHMPTLFSLILAWLLVSSSALILIPYALNRYSDSRWTDPAFLGWMALVVAASTVHGAMAYIMGYRRGGSAWNFLIGATLLTLGLLVVSMRNAGKPESYPEKPKGFIRFLDRLAYRNGDLTWGILQLVVGFSVMIRATVYETQKGSEVGSEAAYASYYNSWWMGLLFILFWSTLYCATMRKYPFRFSQSAWLMTHAGLLTLIIGCLVMYWGSWSGYMSIVEGETAAEASSAQERELEVDIPAARERRQPFRIDCDNDPDREEVSQVIDFEATLSGRSEKFRATIDRFYATGRYVDGIVPGTSNGDDVDGAGAEVEIGGFGKPETLTLLESDPQRAQQDLGQITATIVSARSEIWLNGIGRRYEPQEGQRGELVVQTPEGQLIGRFPVLPEAHDAADPSRGAPLTAAEHALGGTGYTLLISRYFDTWQPSGNGFIDGRPGIAQRPAVDLVIRGPEGEERRLAAANDRTTRYLPNAVKNSYPVEIFYECRPELPLENGQVVLVSGPGPRRTIFLQSREGLKVHDIEENTPYRFSENAPIRVTVRKMLPNAAYQSGWDNEGRENTFKVIRVTVEHGNDRATEWVPLTGTAPMRVGSIDLRLRYAPRKRHLPFSISVLDFRQINHPNSNTPAAFETNIVLRDPARKVEEAILVDMNHPLSHEGYRFFNSNPIDNPSTFQRGIRFSVSRNPGVGIILFGSLVTALGIVAVLFFKPQLRRIEQRRKAAANTAAQGA